jgi:pyruvate/2-oxoglutarate dehydrogenase complex dihydrolipoamide acyltransferase (E2) component
LNSLYKLCCFNVEFSGDLYLSPLVKSIAQQENISETELKTIKGSGLEGRITKEDILAYVKNRGNQPAQQAAPVQVLLLHNRQFLLRQLPLPLLQVMRSFLWTE